MSTARAAQAREQNQLAQEARAVARQHREQRDALVRQLRSEDPGQWTYRAIAAAVGITPELAAAIITGREPRPKPSRTATTPTPREETP